MALVPRWGSYTNPVQSYLYTYTPATTITILHANVLFEFFSFYSFCFSLKNKKKKVGVERGEIGEFNWGKVNTKTYFLL